MNLRFFIDALFYIGYFLRMSPAEQIAFHIACVIAKRLAQKPVDFHYAGIARAVSQLSPA